jgi:hypothetical protein
VGASVLFIFMTANPAASPMIAITAPAIRPPDPFFSAGAAAAVAAALDFDAAVIGTTFALAGLAAAAAATAAGFFSSSSKSPSVAGFAFSAAAFCSAVAAALIVFRFTTPESSSPASGGLDGLTELNEEAGGGGVEAKLFVRLSGADGGPPPGRDAAPDWLARAAISFSEPRLRSDDRAGAAVLGAALIGLDSVLGALWSDSWDIFFSPAETIGA